MVAFDYVTSKISTIEAKEPKIMYLGDSDNDNPAFTKADVSIGIRSDDRLNAKLSIWINFSKVHYGRLL
jgi:phosphoserine phosphatase